MYQRLQFGPAPVEMPPVMNELLRDGLVRQERREVFGHTEHRSVPLVDPVLNFFSKDDVAFLDESIGHYWAMTGMETSDESHGVAWKSRSDGDLIPYEASYFEDAPLRDTTLENLAKVGTKYSWQSA